MILLAAAEGRPPCLAEVQLAAETLGPEPGLVLVPTGALGVRRDEDGHEWFSSAWLGEGVVA